MLAPTTARSVKFTTGERMGFVGRGEGNRGTAGGRDGGADCVLMAQPSDDQLVREAIAAWNRGDWEATLEMISPDVEWRLSEPLFDIPQVSYGHDGVWAFWEKWTEIWDEIHVEIERTVPFDDGTVAFVRWRARGRDGVEVDQQVVFAFTIRDGKSTRFLAFWSPEAAVEALGLPPLE